MTIMGAINHIDAVKPNSYTQQEKVKWLSTLDSTVKQEIIDTHEGGESVAFIGYDAETPVTKELLVGTPYDEIYVRYLEMQIDYANGEYGKYENTSTMFNTAYTAFERWYNRTHMPLGKKFSFF